MNLAILYTAYYIIIHAINTSAFETNIGCLFFFFLVNYLQWHILLFLCLWRGTKLESHLFYTCRHQHFWLFLWECKHTKNWKIQPNSLKRDDKFQSQTNVTRLVSFQPGPITFPSLRVPFILDFFILLFFSTLLLVLFWLCSIATTIDQIETVRVFVAV